MPDGEWTRDEESAQRRRAAWGLGILALVAAIVVSVMAFVLGTSGDPSPSKVPLAGQVPLATHSTSRPAPSGAATNNGRPAGAPDTQLTAPSTSAASTHATPKRRHHHHSSAPPSVPPTGGRVSCPSGNPCTAPGDIGNVMGAVNDFRAANGQPAASGRVTTAAQQCAIGSGDGSACPTSYFWEPVSGPNGQQVVEKIVGNGGTSFLLDPHATFEVGWAYEPASHQYECALVSD